MVFGCFAFFHKTGVILEGIEVVYLEFANDLRDFEAGDDNTVTQGAADILVSICHNLSSIVFFAGIMLSSLTLMILYQGLLYIRVHGFLNREKR